jgi:hypothetical protein
MTRENEKLTIDRKVVVVFDICSSTSILEDLKRTDNLAAWRNFLIGLKEGMVSEGSKFGMEVYKFIGDGWILFFPESLPKQKLCTFLQVLSTSFDAQFECSIRPLLSQVPDSIGLMFGIDAGELIRLELNEQIEYLGRAINVASRLQSGAKQLKGGASYKALFSKNSFNSPAPPSPGLEVTSVTISLPNVTPSLIECLVFQAYPNPEVRPLLTRQKLPLVSTEFSLELLSKTMSNPKYASDVSRLDRFFDRKSVINKETIIIVVGGTIPSELLDRPTAELLRDHIDRQGEPDSYRRAVVITDQVWINENSITDNAVIAVGGPPANKLTAEFIKPASAAPPTGGTYSIPGAGDQKGFFRKNAVGLPQVALWGSTAKSTREAVEHYLRDTAGLTDFLKICWK